MRVSPILDRALKLIAFVFIFAPILPAEPLILKGIVTDPQGEALPHAAIQIVLDNAVFAQTSADAGGRFEIRIDAKDGLQFRVMAVGFEPTFARVPLNANGSDQIVLQVTGLSTESTSITVTADVNDLDVVSPDPGEKVFVRQDLLDRKSVV